MRQRKLGQLGTSVSAVGYGAMSLTDFYGATDDEKSYEILTRCLDLGITHLDISTAYGVGKSEKHIGFFLARQGKQAYDMLKSRLGRRLLAIMKASAVLIITRNTSKRS